MAFETVREKLGGDKGKAIGDTIYNVMNTGVMVGGLVIDCGLTLTKTGEIIKDSEGAIKGLKALSEGAKAAESIKFEALKNFLVNPLKDLVDVGKYLRDNFIPPINFGKLSLAGVDNLNLVNIGKIADDFVRDNNIGNVSSDSGISGLINRINRIVDDFTGGGVNNGVSNPKNINVEEVIPPGAQNPVKVYTDGNAQVNKGKIETYIRGKIQEPPNYYELKDRISELTKLKKKNPSEFTIEMDKELKAADKIVHNYERSKAMGELLDDAGIADTPENNEKIAEIVLDSAKEVTPKNTKIKSTINIGNKPVIVESWWIVDKNGTSYCSTIILIEVK